LLYTLSQDGLEFADDTTVDACLWIHAWHQHHALAAHTTLSTSTTATTRQQRLSSQELEDVAYHSQDVQHVIAARTQVLVTEALSVCAQRHTAFLEKLATNFEDAIAWQSRQNGPDSVLHSLLAVRATFDGRDNNVLSACAKHTNATHQDNGEQQGLEALHHVCHYLQQQSNDGAALFVLLNAPSRVTGMTAIAVAAAHGRQDAVLALHLWGARLDVFSYDVVGEDTRQEEQDGDDQGGKHDQNGVGGNRMMAEKPGGTPLMLAAQHGHASCVLVLLEAGAQCRTVYDSWGRTARDVAAEGCVGPQEEGGNISNTTTRQEGKTTEEKVNNRTTVDESKRQAKPRSNKRKHNNNSDSNNIYRYDVAQCAAILSSHVSTTTTTTTTTFVPPGPDPPLHEAHKCPTEHRSPTWSLEQVIKPNRTDPAKAHRISVLLGSPLQQRGASELQRLSQRPMWGECAPYSPRGKTTFQPLPDWLENSAIDREIALATEYDVQQETQGVSGVEHKTSATLSQHPVIVHARTIRQPQHDTMVSFFGHAGHMNTIAHLIRGQRGPPTAGTTPIEHNTKHSLVGPACYAVAAPRGSSDISDYPGGNVLHAAAHDGYAPSFSLLWCCHLLHYSKLLANIIDEKDHKHMTPLLRAAGSKCHGATLTRRHSAKTYKKEFSSTPASDHFLCLLQHGANVYSRVGSGKALAIEKGQEKQSFATATSSNTTRVTSNRTTTNRTTTNRTTTTTTTTGDTALHLAARRGDASICALLAHVTDFDGPDIARHFRLATNHHGETAADVAPLHSLAWQLVAQHEDAPIPREFEIVQQYMRRLYKPPAAPTSEMASLPRNHPPAVTRLTYIHTLEAMVQEITDEITHTLAPNHAAQQHTIATVQQSHDKQLALLKRKSTSQVLTQVERYKSKMQHQFLELITSTTAKDMVDDLQLYQKLGQGYDISKALRALKEEKDTNDAKNAAIEHRSNHVLNCLSKVQVDTLLKVNFATNMINKRKYEQETDDIKKLELKIMVDKADAFVTPEHYTAVERSKATRALNRIASDREECEGKLNHALNRNRRTGHQLSGALMEGNEKRMFACGLLAKARVASKNSATWTRFEMELEDGLVYWGGWGSRHLEEGEGVVVEGEGALKEDEGKKEEEGKEEEEYRYRFYSSDGESSSDFDDGS